ncbi:glycosyltransferase family 2 protein [Flavobacterium sp. NKUCC04_CG]|uniref:glycosyltransferase family 2 protein n=1 Tax=Flavobacterium sp. NKUCC04_CG TaxID=2842121 RepID=UPI001C5BECC4|nr:glycosyltransferase family 2 protein [Flavobacterium sp. NKUCC04_CG]MBW3519639.1 glycosyltransferase family 2 protein [Flavobacterium sp. NKUCC04_CG]
MKLSVIIPTYNEYPYLEDAVHSVSFADEIIVIDSFSTDGTAALAVALGCKVVERKFDNFSAQKNHAIPLAKGDWILFLDADERITLALQAEILSKINQSNYGGYKLRFPHFFLNRFLYHKADRVTRLVRNNGIYFTGDVHEKLHIPEGKIGILNNYVLHYTYKGIFHFLSKKESYAWFQAGEFYKKKKKITYFHLAFKPFYRFFSTYILKRGFMDGVAGFAGSATDAYGVFARYAKAMLLERGLK